MLWFLNGFIQHIEQWECHKMNRIQPRLLSTGFQRRKIHWMYGHYDRFRKVTDRYIRKCSNLYRGEGLMSDNINIHRLL